MANLNDIVDKQKCEREYGFIKAIVRIKDDILESLKDDVKVFDKPKSKFHK